MKSLTNRKRRKIPPTTYPTATELEYYRLLRRELVAWFNSLYRSLQQAGLDITVRLDDFGSTFDAARRQWGDRAESLKGPLRDLAQQVDNLNSISFTRQVKATQGENVASIHAINPFTPGVTGELEAFTSENVRLIKGIGDQAANRIQTLVNDAVRQGTSTQKLNKALREEFEFSKKRAALIARDQIGKLNGNVTRVRQTAAGIEKYEWSTSRDTRVRRVHAQREGKVFSWDRPPPDGHPGSAVQCRCSAIPVFEDEDMDEAARPAAGVSQPKPPPASPSAPGPKSGAKRGKRKPAASGGGGSGTTRRPPGAPTGGKDPGDIRRDFYDFEKRIVGNPAETAIVFDDDGTVIFEKRGTRNQVSFESYEILLFRNNRFTHNHPAGSGFSSADIAFAMAANVKEMRVAGRYGGDEYLYTLSRKGDYWAPAEFSNHSHSDLWMDAHLTAFMRFYYLEEAKARRTLQPQVDSGVITSEEAQFRHNDIVARALAARLDLNYERIKI